MLCEQAGRPTPIGAQKPAAEVAWLIEMHDMRMRAMWWTGDGFTFDSLEAVRFSREIDARRVIDWALSDISELRATEHMWC